MIRADESGEWWPVTLRVEPDRPKTMRDVMRALDRLDRLLDRLEDNVPTVPIWPKRG